MLIRPCTVCEVLRYLTRWHQVESVKQKQTKALDKEHVVTVLPQKQEGEGGGAHGEIAEHLQGDARSSAEDSLIKTDVNEGLM